MKRFIVLLTLAMISSCADKPKPLDSVDKEYGWVKIYSTSDFKIAQAKADVLCGHRAYYLKDLHENNLETIKRFPDGYHSYYYPFQCNLNDAANAGNPEAKAIYDKELSDAYKRLDEAKRHQYEVHKASAKKNGYDSYSIVNPDGSIEAHSINSKGHACHSTVDTYGAYTACD
ncbi:TPA: hypothetical protein I8287_003475 [Kluyvera intermedia]|nr:hypothetical protein [Kluyvera intermedia]